MKIVKSPLFWIFLLALILRIYKLAEFPYGFHVDEVKIGWNALSVLTTGITDQLKPLGFFYNSFGDYRPSGIFYLTIPSLLAFGQTIFAVRFPSAFFGALSILPIYFLALEFSKKQIQIRKFNTGHIAAFLTAISPWYIQVGRATSEVVISTFFGLFAIFFFIKLIKTHKAYFVFLSFFSLFISYFFYHSIRFLGPIFFFLCIIYYFSILKQSKKIGLIVITFISTLILSFLFTLSTSGVGRLNQISIFTDVDTQYEIERVEKKNKKELLIPKILDNKIVIYTKSIIHEYGSYFSSDFLIGYSARPYRYATPGSGLLNFIDIVFIIIGLIAITRGKKEFLPILILLVAPIPAAITIEDAPNLHRALFMLPFLLIIESYGIEFLLSLKGKLSNILYFLIFILLALSTTYFLYNYFNHAISHRPYIKTFYVDSPTYRNVGVVELVKKLDNFGEKYDKVIITNSPDSPYPWYAFFTNKEPSDINSSFSSKTNERIYGNIIFSEDKCPSRHASSKYKNEKILIIDSGDCPDSPLKTIDSIKRPDGDEVYALLEKSFRE